MVVPLAAAQNLAAHGWPWLALLQQLQAWAPTEGHGWHFWQRLKDRPPMRKCYMLLRSTSKCWDRLCAQHREYSASAGNPWHAYPRCRHAIDITPLDGGVGSVSAQGKPKMAIVQDADSKFCVRRRIWPSIGDEVREGRAN